MFRWLAFWKLCVTFPGFTYSAYLINCYYISIEILSYLHSPVVRISLKKKTRLVRLCDVQWEPSTLKCNYKILAIKSRKWLECASSDLLSVFGSQRSHLVRISKWVQATNPPMQASRRTLYSFLFLLQNETIICVKMLHWRIVRWTTVDRMCAV
jgi:hypothetical protein